MVTQIRRIRRRIRMKYCKLCLYWNGQVYCEKSRYIVDPKYAENCKDYVELADEIVKAAKGGY